MVDTEVLILSRNEFLGLQGLSFPISDYLEDKMRGNIDSYHDRRNKAIQEYDHLVASGKIKPPTRIQKSLKIAQGHPDNRSVQAARRMLAKRGYDWQTGEPINVTC